jgi:nicotinamide-nucleotide amidase
MIDPEVLALAERVIAENRAAGRCIATVESCTGGMVAAALTDVPGSSDVFERGWVTYSNTAKTEQVGVSDDIVATFGAVSEATAWAMATGGLAHSKADVAVAITGIAGPGGGTPRKPIGMVVFARAARGDAQPSTEEMSFGDLGRAEIRRQATLKALELLLP